MNKKIVLNILILNIFGSIGYISFISGFLTVLLSKHISDPLLISFAIALKKFSKIFTDIPFGIIADLYGVKKLFIYSRAIPIISLLCLLSDVSSIVLIGFLLHGISITVLTGKIEAAFYTILLKENKTNLFSKIISIFYFFNDIVLSLIGFASAMMFKKYGYNILIYCTIATSFLSIIPLYFFKDESFLKEGIQKIKIKEITSTFLEYSKTNKTMISVILLSALCNFFGGQFLYVADMIYIDLKFQTQNLAITRAFSHLSMSLGCILAFFIASKVSLQNASKMIIFNLIIMLFFAFSYSQTIVMPIILYMLFYATIELVIIREIERMAVSSIRNTITSVTTFSSTVFNILGMVSMGASAKYLGGYKNGFIAFLMFFLSLSIYLFYKIKNLNQKSSLINN